MMHLLIVIVHRSYNCSFYIMRYKGSDSGSGIGRKLSIIRPGATTVAAPWSVGSMTTKGQMKPNSRVSLTVSQAGENSQTNGPEHTIQLRNFHKNQITKEIGISVARANPFLWSRPGYPIRWVIQNQSVLSREQDRYKGTDGAHWLLRKAALSMTTAKREARMIRATIRDFLSWGSVLASYFCKLCTKVMFSRWSLANARFFSYCRRFSSNSTRVSSNRRRFSSELARAWILAACNLSWASRTKSDWHILRSSPVIFVHFDFVKSRSLTINDEDGGHWRLQKRWPLPILASGPGHRAVTKMLTLLTCRW